MADFENNPQDELDKNEWDEVPEGAGDDGVEYEYVDENGNPVDADGNPIGGNGEDVEYEYVEDDGAAAVSDGEDVSYAEEGEEPEYVEEGADGLESEDGALNDEIVTDDELPDGMSVEVEDTMAEEYASAEDGALESEEESSANEVEKGKSLFGRLAEASPYDVMIWASFFLLLVGILLMLFEWMSYDMIVYPPYN